MVTSLSKTEFVMHHNGRHPAGEYGMWVLVGKGLQTGDRLVVERVIASTWNEAVEIASQSARIRRATDYYVSNQNRRNKEIVIIKSSILEAQLKDDGSGYQWNEPIIVGSDHDVEVISNPPESTVYDMIRRRSELLKEIKEFKAKMRAQLEGMAADEDILAEKIDAGMAKFKR